MAVAVLLTGDLAGGDLVQQLLGAVRHAGRGDVGGADPGLPVLQVGDELVGELLVAVGDGVVRPERLLQLVPAGPLLARLQAVLTGVRLRVDVTEALGDRLGTLPAHPGGREQRLGLLRVAGLDGVGELLDDRDGGVGLLLRVLAVRGHGRVQARVALGRGTLAGHGDLLADAVAGHTGLAGHLVVAGLDLRRDGGLGAGADVLALGDDLVAWGVDVDLGRLRALVVHLDADVTGREGGLRHLAGAVGGADLDGVGGGRVVLLLRAAGQHDGRDCEGEQRGCGRATG